MGLFGGSAQGTASAVNTLDFNPVINVGDGISTSLDKTLDTSATVTPRLDDSFGISAVVPIQSSTGNNDATTSRQQSEDYQPITTKTASETSNLSGVNSTYLIIGALGVGAVLYYALKK